MRQQFTPKRPTSGASKPLPSDYPLAAHTRAIRAFDEYDACVTEYRLLLDAQRAMLASDNADGVVQIAMKGDIIARRVAQCGRRIAPVQETLAAGSHSGARTTELGRRLAVARVKAEQLTDAISQVSLICVEKRETVSAELTQERTAQTVRSRVAYTTPMRTKTALDIRY